MYIAYYYSCILSVRLSTFYVIFKFYVIFRSCDSGNHHTIFKICMGDSANTTHHTNLGKKSAAPPFSYSVFQWHIAATRAGGGLDGDCAARSLSWSQIFDGFRVLRLRQWQLSQNCNVYLLVSLVLFILSICQPHKSTVYLLE